MITLMDKNGRIITVDAKFHATQTECSQSAEELVVTLLARAPESEYIIAPEIVNSRRTATPLVP